MNGFDPANYGPVLGPLLDVDRCRPLGPGTPQPVAELARLTPQKAFAHTRLADEEMGRLCLAGMWLLYDELDASHRISQDIDSREGSYWHGIMHRREPDYSNSKYWFRRVGVHPVFAPLQAAAARLAGGASDPEIASLAAQAAWDAPRFVDLCQAIAQGRSGSEAAARQIAQAEWELLFDHCYRAAVA